MCVCVDQLRRLQIFRDVLGEGLHVHFVENELLQDIFDFSGTTQLGNAMDRLELRQIHSPTSDVSKERSRNLKKNRNQRMAVLSANTAPSQENGWDSS
ncbi:hypothetical protein BDF22DRAFT_685398 [Syncephalis plumigaleata]|nr:hypothetical protein BDF22DRAFT_685398 [Syncephalis plumigaleata]